MTEQKRDRSLGEAAGASRRGDAEGESAGRNKTAGTNRDFDEKNIADNQGHGHPREERERRSED